MFGGRAWAGALAELSAADREAPLAPDDLEQLATAAYLAGSDEESVELWERAHRELLHAGESLRAVRCATWLVFVLVNGGQIARSGGWLSRLEVIAHASHHPSLEQPEAFNRRLLEFLSGCTPAASRSGL